MNDNDFPPVMANGGNEVGFLRKYMRGMSDFSQQGTDIPDLRLQERYAQEEGGPLVGETIASNTPRFLREYNEQGPTAPEDKMRQIMERHTPGINQNLLDVHKKYSIFPQV